MAAKFENVPDDMPWTESVPLHSPGEWVTYTIDTSSPDSEVAGTHDRLVSIRLNAPPSVEELDVASMKFLDRRARFGSASYGVTREAIGRDASQCVFAYCPSEMSWKTEIKKGARLEGEWGFLGEGPLKMVLALRDGDGEHELAQTTLNTEDDSESLKVELNRWAGQEVEFVWRTEGPEQTVALWGSPIVWGGGRGKQPNVVVYLVDALRPDRLGCYGSTDELTPNADALAAQGTVFLRAYAAANWTHASVPSLLMGVLPDVHGANITGYKVRGDTPTLAEVFASEGYATASYLANGYSGTFTDLDRGFDTVRCLLNAYSDELINEDLREWIADHGDLPFFLYLHTMDPHARYEPRGADLSSFDPTVGGKACEWDPYYDPEALRGKVTAEGRRARYGAEVRDADQGLASLIAWLDEFGVSANTVVVFIADHGEYLGENGEWGHGGPRMNIEVLQVPMIWRWPGGGILQQEVRTPVSLLDVFPTLLAAAGIQDSSPGYLQGVSLLRTLKTGDKRALAGRAIWFMETSPAFLKSCIRGDYQFLSNGERFVRSPETGKWQAETSSKEDAEREFESWPTSKLPPPSSLATSGQVEIRHDQLEALKALGYVK